MALSKMGRQTLIGFCAIVMRYFTIGFMLALGAMAGVSVWQTLVVKV